MIWDDAAFKDAYRTRLKDAQSSCDVEAAAQARAFQAEAARAGGSSPEHFTQRAGAAAAVTLAGYVKSALDAFDETIAAVEADLEDADLIALRDSLEKEIALRAKALPAALRDFCRPTAHPAPLRTILQQAPVKARQLLAERLTSVRERVRTQVRAQELLDRAIFIGHGAGDETIAGALKLAIVDAVGSDAPLYTSSDLASILAGRDGFERVLTLLKKSRMTLVIVTPESSESSWLWWAVGVAAGAAKPAFVLRAPASADTAIPIGPAQQIDLASRDDLLRLLAAIQGEVRRRPKDPTEIDLQDLMREV